MSLFLKDALVLVRPASKQKMDSIYWQFVVGRCEEQFDEGINLISH